MSLLTDVWGIIVLVSVLWVIYDVLTQNKRLSSAMKVVWILAALILGIIGAILYYLFGRK